MTTEEKLEKAIEFIKSIERLDACSYDIFSSDDIDAVCNECESDDIHIYGMNGSYIDCKVLDELSNKAWHVLADITE